MKIREEIHVKIKERKVAQAMKDALLPEAQGAQINDRSKISKLELRGKRLSIEVSAEDLTALRASTDSKLRWIGSLSSCLSSVKERKNKNF